METKTHNVLIRISIADFINWYFNTGADQEKEMMAKELGWQIIDELSYGSAVITPQGFLDQCNQDIIPLAICQGLHNQEGELGEVFPESKYNLKIELF